VSKNCDNKDITVTFNSLLLYLCILQVSLAISCHVMPTVLIMKSMINNHGGHTQVGHGNTNVWHGPCEVTCCHCICLFVHKSCIVMFSIIIEQHLIYSATRIIA